MQILKIDGKLLGNCIGHLEKVIRRKVCALCPFFQGHAGSKEQELEALNGGKPAFAILCADLPYDFLFLRKEALVPFSFGPGKAGLHAFRLGCMKECTQGGYRACATSPEELFSDEVNNTRLPGYECKQGSKTYISC